MKGHLDAMIDVGGPELEGLGRPGPELELHLRVPFASAAALTSILPSPRVLGISGQPASHPVMAVRRRLPLPWDQAELWKKKSPFWISLTCAEKGAISQRTWFGSSRWVANDPW